MGRQLRISTGTISRVGATSRSHVLLADARPNLRERMRHGRDDVGRVRAAGGQGDRVGQAQRRRDAEGLHPRLREPGEALRHRDAGRGQGQDRARQRALQGQGQPHRHRRAQQLPHLRPGRRRHRRLRQGRRQRPPRRRGRRRHQAQLRRRRPDRRQDRPARLPPHRQHRQEARRASSSPTSPPRWAAAPRLSSRHSLPGSEPSTNAGASRRWIR